MLPSNIDLTENRDFGRSGGDWVIPIAFSDDEIVTSDEYENLCRYESIFGKRMKDQTREILGYLYDLDFPVDWNKICIRCGKPLLPWNNRGGICMECDGELNQSYGYGSFPWTNYKTPRLPDNIMDIFNLR